MRPGQSYLYPGIGIVLIHRHPRMNPSPLKPELEFTNPSYPLHVISSPQPKRSIQQIHPTNPHSSLGQYAKLHPKQVGMKEERISSLRVLRV